MLFAEDDFEAETVEEEIADVVIASPEMALLSESAGLLAGGELSGGRLPQAAPFAQPESSSKQSFPALSLPLQLPASLASTARSDRVLNTSASGAPVRTGRSDLTTISRGEIMSSERLRELEAVTAANGGVGVGIGVESGGEGEQQQQMATSDGEELLDRSGGGEQPYFDSLVRNKLPKRPAEEASPRAATNGGSSARRLKTAGGLAADSHSDLLPSRPQRPAKNKQAASDQIAAPVELSDTRRRSGAEGRATRGSGSDLQYPATMEGSHSEVSSSRKSFDSVVPAAGRHALAPSPPTRPQPDRPPSRTSSNAAAHRAHRSHESESNSSDRARHRNRSSERRAAQQPGGRDGDLTPIPTEEQPGAPLTPPGQVPSATAAAEASSSRNNRAEARRKRVAGLTQRALEEHAEAEAQLASHTLLGGAPPQKQSPVKLQQRGSNSEAIDAGALLADMDANGDEDAELAAAVEALMQAQRESTEQETPRDGDGDEELAMGDGHQTGPRAQRERPANPVLHSNPAAIASQTHPVRPSLKQQQQQQQRASQAEQTVEAEAEGSDVPAESELDEVREQDASDQPLQQPPTDLLLRRGAGTGISQPRSGSSGRPTGDQVEPPLETRGGRGGRGPLTFSAVGAAHQNQKQNGRSPLSRSNGLATTSGVSSAPDQSRLGLPMNGSGVGVGVPPPLSERSSLHSERSALAIQAFDSRLSRLEGALTRFATSGAPSASQASAAAGAAAAPGGGPSSDPSRRAPFESPSDEFYSDMQHELADLKTVFSSTLANQTKQVHLLLHLLSLKEYCESVSDVLAKVASKSIIIHKQLTVMTYEFLVFVHMSSWMRRRRTSKRLKRSSPKSLSSSSSGLLRLSPHRRALSSSPIRPLTRISRSRHLQPRSTSCASARTMSRLFLSRPPRPHDACLLTAVYLKAPLLVMSSQIAHSPRPAVCRRCST